MKAFWYKKILQFKQPSGTSRGILKTKPTYFLVLQSTNFRGIGECSPLIGLSYDDRPGYEERLDQLIAEIQSTGEGQIDKLVHSLVEWPSIRFGLEMALLDLKYSQPGILFPSKFTEGEQGIPINGLIWMGTPAFMREQIAKLLDRGFKCLKMKIGAINFQEEYEILQNIRREYSKDDLILRVDANGAFPINEALEKLKQLSELDLHSIEQPIKAGQSEEMAELCENTPVPIALDEELISKQESSEKGEILEIIKPQYIIIKPSLVGGFQGAEEWINVAEKLGVQWWATSALESNIGLSAISQWTFSRGYVGHQGLGTGSLFINNISSPLVIKGEELFYRQESKWNYDDLEG